MRAGLVPAGVVAVVARIRSGHGFEPRRGDAFDALTGFVFGVTSVRTVGAAVTWRCFVAAR